MGTHHSHLQCKCADLYTVIHDKTGVEPGLSHYYYEIMRADTSSEATIAKYKQLAIDYHNRCDHINDNNQ